MAPVVQQGIHFRILVGGRVTNLVYVNLRGVVLAIHADRIGFAVTPVGGNIAGNAAFSPGGGLYVNFNTQLFGFLTQSHGSIVTVKVVTAPGYGKFGVYAVLINNTVTVGIFPTGIGQNLFSFFHLAVFKFGGACPRSIPGIRIRRRTIPVQSLINNLLAANTDVQRFADGRIAGYIIADFFAVFRRFFDHRQVKQEDIRHIIGFLFHIFDFVFGKLRAYQNYVKLTGFCGSKGSVLIHL